jgi:hypothetical protein
MIIINELIESKNISIYFLFAVFKFIPSLNNQHATKEKEV